MSLSDSALTSGVSVTGLNCSYGSQQVVWDASVRVPRAGGVAVVGRNGVGKTTLLRGIARAFGVRSSGRIIIDGTDVSNWRADRISHIGLSFVPDDRRILPLSVKDNLRLGARSHTGWRDRVDEVVEMFPLLKNRLDQRGDTMSGGEQQALAIGRALMAQPRYLLLDEPAEGLAPALVDQLVQALRVFRDKADIGILLVDRNVGLISQLCTEVIGMSKGRILHNASAAEFAADEQLRAKFLAPVAAEPTPA